MHVRYRRTPLRSEELRGRNDSDCSEARHRHGSNDEAQLHTSAISANTFGFPLAFALKKHRLEGPLYNPLGI